MQNDNKVPPKPWTAPIDTNIFKLFYYRLNGVHAKVYQKYGQVALLGEQVADLTLQALDGRQVRLRDYQGKKHLVLEFGAVT